MRKIQLILICLLLTITKIQAQEPQFKFHLAFEDATGAKDTVWLIWDSLATEGPTEGGGQTNLDTLFGEIPMSLPTGVFRVYVELSANDSGKVRAIPLNWALYGFPIKAQNYVYPINMYWDTSLIFNNNLPFVINTAYLGNDWFFFNNNDPLNQIYHMQYEDSIQLPWFSWGSQDQFPINFNFGYDYILNVGIDEKEIKHNRLVVYPNPSSNKLLIKLKDNIDTAFELKLIDVRGTVLKQLSITNNRAIIDISDLPIGLYFIEVFNEKFSYREKIIKY